MPINLLHCADLHLDAVLGDSVQVDTQEHLSPEEMALLRDAPLLALDSILEIAHNNSVNLIVIAGDIFDRKENTAVLNRALTRFSSFLHKAVSQGIHIAIALGNHDPLSTIETLKSSWPENVYVFNKNNPESININIGGQEVFIHGVSFATNDESRNLASLFPAKKSDAFNIGVLHTNVSSNSEHSNYAPSTIETLASFNYDYFALGHIHKRVILNEHPKIAYSGNSQGLSAKPSEQEPKGCFVVSIDSPEGNAICQFHPTDNVRYTTVNLICENAKSIEDVIDAFDETISNSNTADHILYLTRLNISINKLDFLLDSETLKEAINSLRTNTVVTQLSIDQSLSTWEDLVANEEFFARINSSLFDNKIPTPEDLYGSKFPLVESYLNHMGDEPEDKSINKILQSDPDDMRTQIIDLLVSTHSQLNAKGK